jgi:hypothetical protein
MISSKLSGLAAHFETTAQAGTQTLSPLRQRSIAAVLRDLAEQVDALERQVVPANARHAGEGDKVVQLKPARMPVQPVIATSEHGGAA